jgi:predicted protein tyrosine phosphatase
VRPRRRAGASVRPLNFTVRHHSVRRVLFVCSQNRLRSPTAEQVFRSWPGIEVASAGLDASAEKPVTSELLQWAHIIFVMEKSHRSKLSKKFKSHIKNHRIICLNIPDEYEYMDPRLVSLLQAVVPRYL